MVNGNQMTLFWHVEDRNDSHKNSNAIYEFIDWVRKA